MDLLDDLTINEIRGSLLYVAERDQDARNLALKLLQRHLNALVQEAKVFFFAFFSEGEANGNGDG